MAGVKQFDQNEVLDRAMMLFWSQGYEATSIDQLVEATGINRGSLYSTFNDKNGIFLAVIDRYLETVAKSLMVTLSDPNPRQAIERMFDSIVGRLSDPKFPRGCLIVNTSLECPASGDAIARRMRKQSANKNPQSIAFCFGPKLIAISSRPSTSRRSPASFWE